MEHNTEDQILPGSFEPETSTDVVLGCKEITQHKSTTWNSSGPITRAALDDLRALFDKMKHAPSPSMWDALTANLSTMEAMADGNAAPSIYISTLEPGIGKTQAMLAF